MRTESKKISTSSWPKLAMKKWLNIKTSAEKFHSDNDATGDTRQLRRRGERVVQTKIVTTSYWIISQVIYDQIINMVNDIDQTENLPPVNWFESHLDNFQLEMRRGPLFPNDDIELSLTLI
ncbi:hypothetical protein VNO78_17578 [Psophocarpus tetragonolobus]|uniref:Uncharacterized protein n=1 Tax=Psophocarpus tetragonolobus TaxID=3891 RepID=A0AAN9SJ69_PSOTE